MRKIKLLIDSFPYQEKPSGADIGSIKYRLKDTSSVKEVTVAELLDYISKGHTICPAVLKNGTASKDWIQQELIGIDIDNEIIEEDILYVDKAIKLLSKKNINPFGYYYSFSNSEDKPKYRLLFILDEIINNPDTMKFILERIVELLPQADKKCVDLARIFFGTNQKVEIINANATINLESVISLGQQKKKKEKTENKNQDELNKLIADYDLLEYMKKDNEVERCTNKYVMFKNCSVCGHKGCLVYYKDENIFTCFGANGGITGNIINYLMVTKNITKIEAIRYFKYELLGMEDPAYMKQSNSIDAVKSQLQLFDFNPDANINVDWIHCEEVPTRNGIVVMTKILCPKLAEFIRKNTHYIFVRNDAKSGILRYFYINGYYRLVSEEELKGVIKQFIPLEHQKTKDINEVYNLLSTDLKFTDINKLNADENIINFENGVLELDTGELKPHSSEYLCTIRIPCNYVENVPVPSTKYFDRFINDLTNGDADVKRLILQFMGVILSNVRGYRMKQALMMVGAGNTGKSICKNFLTTLLGNENYSSIDLKDLEKRFSKVQLLNKRLVGSNDMSYMTISELETFKQATGGDPIYAEFKGENGINFVFKGVLFFSGNRLPKFCGDRGDWVYNRIVVVECNNVIPEEKQDKQLNEHLQEEKDYIVSLAINELKQVIKNGYKYNIPESCKLLKEDYKITNHSFLTFMKECVIERPDYKVKDGCTVKRFYDVYKEWCKDNNNGYAETKREIHKLLEQLGKSDKIKTGGFEYYKKITLSDEAKKDYEKVYGFSDVVRTYSYSIEEYDKIINTSNN